MKEYSYFQNYHTYFPEILNYFGLIIKHHNTNKCVICDHFNFLDINMSMRRPKLKSEVSFWQLQILNRTKHCCSF